MCFTKQTGQTSSLFSQTYKNVYVQSNACENTHLPFIIKALIYLFLKINFRVFSHYTNGSKLFRQPQVRLMYNISIQPTSISVNATTAPDTRRFHGNSLTHTTPYEASEAKL